jgi:murein DD-endopeptidase MepM/ murein hydrolase activator NlpD
VLALPAAPAFAHSAVGVPRLVFPIVAETVYEDDFGDPRPQGSHEGIDILAPRRAVVVAAEAGTVKIWIQSRAGCMLYLYGKSGTTYLYVHLNNDRGPGNDNLGGCKQGIAYAPGLRSGQRVEAGEPLGYVGDSGDADGAATHLHFEVHPGGGGAADPYPHLRRAQHLLFAVDSKTTVTLTLSGAVTQAVGGRLSVQVDDLQLFPGDAPVFKPIRPLTLAFPADTMVAAGSSLTQAGGPPSTLAGRRVIVLTQPTTATLSVALGQPGALAAARVVVSASQRSA